ncbi:MAG: hypothetical protein FJZ01_00705 [Candidatus Sericytochromatia bacterium]|nr:hypothetical protein [Candidatus Tanganyikabacteria bacterium]
MPSFQVPPPGANTGSLRNTGSAKGSSGSSVKESQQAKAEAKAEAMENANFSSAADALKQTAGAPMEKPPPTDPNGPNTPIVDKRPNGIIP